MEEMLVVLIQAFIEIIFFVLSAFPFDCFLYFLEWQEDSATHWKCFILFLVGLLVGLVSLGLFPKSFIPYQWLRIVTLVAAPFFAGWWSLSVAKVVSLRMDDVWPKRHFWYSFSACFGVVLIRFAFAARV